jgi:hypothetical protein
MTDDYCSEAEALMEIYDDCDDNNMHDSILKHRNPDKNVALMQSLYVSNMNAAIGSTCKCPDCFKQFIKKTWQHKFDNTKCKDRYWNTVDETRKQRACYFN